MERLVLASAFVGLLTGGVFAQDYDHRDRDRDRGPADAAGAAVNGAVGALLGRSVDRDGDST